MSKEQLSRVSVFTSAMILIALVFGSCLNPVSFDEDSLPRIKVDITGSISINDVAVMWLINRTKTVEVVEFTVSRERAENESEEDYAYPKKIQGMPGPGTSLASYHTPTEALFTLSVAYRDTRDGSMGALGPFTVQFPRAQDYRYYLYWTQDGELVMVNEDKMQELPPDPDENYPDPHPSSADAQTLVVVNVTPDQGLDMLEFTLNTDVNPAIYLLQDKPRAKDQSRILLGSGSYETLAYYTDKSGAAHETDPKTTIITGETGSMAVRTNYLYFYKVNGGGYALSPTWPPIPNDASDGNNIMDALNDDQGILLIRNKAEGTEAIDIIQKISINGELFVADPDHPTYPYMVPGDENMYPVDVGIATVSFKPMDPHPFGSVIPRTINSKQITTLDYTRILASLDQEPPAGQGLIRITNNSSAVVTRVKVFSTLNRDGDWKTYLSDEFTPPYAIQYGNMGRVLVGGDDLPLDPGTLQIIQVQVETIEGSALLERVASLSGKIVNIIISEDSLTGGKDSDGNTNPGSTVTVVNNTTTSTTILGAYVFNKANRGSNYSVGMMAGGISSPPSENQSFLVRNNINFPIVEGAQYAARLYVTGNNAVGYIDKDFREGSDLYSLTPESHVRTVILNQEDLPSGMVESFVPISSIGVPAGLEEVLSLTESDFGGGNPQLTYKGSVNLRSILTFNPPEATKTSPITWSVRSGGGYSSLNSDGVLTVTGIAPASPYPVTLQAVIDDAAGSVINKTPFTGEITIKLIYANTIRNKKVTGITFDLPPALGTGDNLNLATLVHLNPSGASINGVPITAADLNWEITSSTSTGSSIALSSSVLEAGTTPGAVTVKATLPSVRNGGTEVTGTITIDITSSVIHKNISSVSLGSGADSLTFYTKNELSGGLKTKVVYTSQELNLTSTLNFNPDDATVQSPVNWNIVSGDKVSLSGGVLKVINGAPPVDGAAVQVKATIPNAQYSASTYSAFVSAPLNVTLHEVYANTIVDLQNNFAFANASMKVSDPPLELKNLVTLVAGSYLDAGTLKTITKDDLTFSKTGGSGTLSGSSFTATAAGTVNFTVTLPASKNGGVQITRNATVTVKADHPDTLTLRIVKQNDSDSIDHLVFVPVTRTFNERISQTGHTKVQWSMIGDVTKASVKGYTTWTSSQGAFETYTNQFTGVILTTGDFHTYLNSKNDYYDIDIPWPTGGNTGYNIFFLEHDGRVRGYVSPGELSPPQNKNFLFYLDVNYAYTYLRAAMGTSTKKSDADHGSKLVQYTTTKFRYVVPIGYDSYYNTASILKWKWNGGGVGVGDHLWHDLTE
jgi:hypothetical protein